ncbi:MAG: N-6 DNA methylase [Oligoflexales bacterium]
MSKLNSPLSNNLYGPNPYWSSSLFNDVYLKNDVPRKYKDIWETDEIGPFYDFLKGLIDLVKDTEKERKENWSESDTIRNWIIPVMRLLGWENECTKNQSPIIEELSFTISENGRKKNYRPDLIYVEKQEFKKFTTSKTEHHERLNEVRNKVTGSQIVLEAKYWDRLQEYVLGNTKGNKKKCDTKGDDGTLSLSPDEQILKYMEITQDDFGILSDGKTWRLFHNEISRGDVKRYFEFDLGNLILDIGKIDQSNTIRKRVNEEAKYFFYLFSKWGIKGDGTHIPIVHEILDYSKKYAAKISENLKIKFVDAMGHAVNSIAACVKERDKETLILIRDVAESHLFNILFVRSCETRKILPIHSTKYYKLSLTEIFDTLDFLQFEPEKMLEGAYDSRFKSIWGEDFSPKSTEIYDRLLRLYGIIHKGDMGFEVHGFKESVFGKDEWKFAKVNKIDNKGMLCILFSLGFTKSEYRSRTFQQIPYNNFTPRQLGEIYESFLEFKLDVAESDMVYHKKQWKVANLSSQKVASLKLDGSCMVRKGQLFFTPDNEDRKVTGSYYTPDYVVDYIVDETLSPIVNYLSSGEVLKFKVCDPAMGSGHFLNAVVNYLTSKYREKKSDELMDDIDETVEESARKVLDSCILGVDINPRAVKLTKMNLWIQSAYAGKKLERLDDQLFIEDALFWIPEESCWKVNAYVGNPPYVNSVILSEKPEYKDRLKEKYESAKGAFDLCALFLEACDKARSKNCRFGFVLPNKLISSENAEGMRDYILSSKNIYIESIEDISHLNVFESASVYPLVLIFASEEKEAVRVRIHEKRFDLLLNRVEKELIHDRDDWLALLLSEGQFDNFESIPLGDLCQINGAATVAEAYEFAEAVSGTKSKSSMKFIVSGNVINFGTTWGYQKTQYLGNGYEKAFFDLSNKKIPEKRRKQYEVKKIVVPNMTKTLKAFFDDGAHTPAKSTSILSDAKVELEVLACFINSDLATKLYRQKFSSLHMNGDALRIGPPQLKKLPVPKVLIDDEAIRAKLVMLYERIAKGVEECLKKFKASEVKRAMEMKKSTKPEIKKILTLVKDVDDIVNLAASSSSETRAA